MQKTKEKNINSIIGDYLKYRYLFLAGFILCVGIAFLYLRYKTVPAYEISSTLLINDKDNGSGAKQSESFSDLGLVKSTRSINDEIGILKSYTLMEEVVKNLSLQVSYFIEGRVNDLEVYSKNIPVNVLLNNSKPVIYGLSVKLIVKNNNQFDLEYEDQDGNLHKSTHKFGQEIQQPYGTFTVVANSEIPFPEKTQTISFKFLKINDLAEQYADKLTIVPVNENGKLLNIIIVDHIKDRGKNILDELMKVYGDESVKYNNKLAEAMITMIDTRLSLLTGELTNVEKNVEEYKQDENLTDVSSNAQLYVQQANDYNRQLAEVRTSMAVLNSLEEYLNQDDNDIPLAPSSLNIQDATLVSLISTFNEMQLRKRRLLQTTPSSNPLVVDINEQSSNLKANILENLKNVKRGLTITQNNLQNSSRRFQSQIQKVPTLERGLTEINRQQSTKQGLYLYLLQKREEEALSVAAPLSNARIIDAGRAGNYPVSPNKTSIYLGAALFGLFLPFCFIYVKKSLNTKIQSEEDIKEKTDAPILGTIAHNDQKNEIIAKKENNALIVELFRLIRFNLKFAGGSDKKHKVILITSGNKGDGKTFFSINLAISLAATGKKIALLSFDLRSPALTDFLDMDYDKGITNYLIDNALNIEDLLKPYPEIENLFIVPSGPVPPNAGELILSEKVGDLIEGLKNDFDYILIDSAPVGKVADSLALYPYIDSTIYIVRQNFTSKDDFEIFDDFYRNKKLKNPMIVLNDSILSKDKEYGYGNS